MSTNDNVARANAQGLNADAATQADLWSKNDDREEDGYRRDEFGNRLDNDGNRVDPDGRPMDIDGNRVNQSGERVDDEGRAFGDGEDDGVIPHVIPPIPPMMGR